MMNDPDKDRENYEIKSGYIIRDTVNGIPCYYIANKLDATYSMKRNGFSSYAITYYFGNGAKNSWCFSPK
jgi:hypothetical protein